MFIYFIWIILFGSIQYLYYNSKRPKVNSYLSVFKMRKWFIDISFKLQYHTFSFIKTSSENITINYNQFFFF